MAILRTITCSVCGKTKQEARSGSDYSSECYECKIANNDRAEREWKAGRDGLTWEERIRDIEHFIYHHGTHYNRPEVFY